MSFPSLLRFSWLGIALIACALYSGAAAEQGFDITDFGAKGDGETVNTTAIQAAVNACSAAGGGTVCVPAGNFVSGTIFFKDRVRLHLDTGARLLGSTAIEDYPPTMCTYPSRTDRYTVRALLWGEGLEDIAITGMGTIDGQGAAFYGKEATAAEMAEIVEAYQAEGRYPPHAGYFNRPYLIRFISCKKVVVQDVTLRDSPMWMQHYLDCDFVTIRGIKVFNHVCRNNDMIDIDGCRNVTIADCIGDTSDDALTLKSTGAKATEHVTITNCVLRSHCNAFKMGTESAGGFRDIAVTNCVIEQSEVDHVIAGRREGLAGIALEIVDGGSLERIAISNITIKDTTAPIFMRLGNRARPPKPSDPKPEVGTFRAVSISNIVATGAYRTGCAIAGLPGHPIEDVTLSNIRIAFLGGGTAEDALAQPGENAPHYPESTMFGILPAYGFYCRHVRGLTLTNVSLSLLSADCRPALVCNDVEDLRLDCFAAEYGPEAPAQVVLQHTRRAFIQGARPRGGTFLAVEDGCADIVMTGCDLRETEEPFVMAPALPPDTVYAAHNIE